MPLCRTIEGVYVVLREWKALGEETPAGLQCHPAKEALRLQVLISCARGMVAFQVIDHCHDTGNRGHSR